MALPRDLQGKAYAEIVRSKIFDPKDRKSIRETARGIGYSYEHVRKVVEGAVTFTRSFNDALCKFLELPADEMWHLAQDEKLLKKYDGNEFEFEIPKNPKLKNAWAYLEKVQRDAVADFADSLAKANRAKRSVEDAKPRPRR